MEKVFKNKPVIDKNGRYSLEQVELDSIKAVMEELTYKQLKDFLALVDFQQKVNSLFFDEEEKYNSFQSESNKAIKEYSKIDKPKEQDLKRCERTIAKALEDYCDVNGKSLILEITRKLCRCDFLKDITNWTFSINEVYADTPYDWMF